MGVKAAEAVAMETDKEQAPPTEKKHYIDSTYMCSPRAGMEIVSPLKDGLGKKIYLLQLYIHVDIVYIQWKLSI